MKNIYHILRKILPDILLNTAMDHHDWNAPIKENYSGHSYLKYVCKKCLVHKTISDMGMPPDEESKFSTFVKGKWLLLSCDEIQVLSVLNE